MFAAHTKKIYAPPALRRFLDARAMGAPQEELLQLSAKAMAEQEEERARMPARRSTLDAVVLDFRAQNEKPPIVDTNSPGETP